MAVLRTLAAICLLRAGPQDLPFSKALTWGWLAGLLAVQWMVARHSGFEIDVAIGRLAITLLIIVGVTGALLRWRNMANRKEQVVAAFAATGLIFTLLVLPIALSLQPPTVGMEPSGQQFLLALLGMVVFIWKLRIDAHIWRHALDMPRGGMLLAVLLMLLEVVLATSLTAAVPAGPVAP